MENCHYKPKASLSTFCLEFTAYLIINLPKNVIHYNYDGSLSHGIKKLRVTCLVRVLVEDPTEELPCTCISGFSPAPREVNFGELVCKFYQRKANWVYWIKGPPIAITSGLVYRASVWCTFKLTRSSPITLNFLHLEQPSDSVPSRF